MRVAIAEDQVLFREGVVRVLVGAGIEVTAEVGDAGALLAAVRADPPDLVILDVRLPPTFTAEGLHAALELRAAMPELAVVVLSQHVETELALRLLGDDPRPSATCSRTG